MQNDTDMFIRKNQVKKITGLSDTTIWRLEKARKFPKRRYLSANIRGWLHSEVLAWIESRPIVNGEG